MIDFEDPIFDWPLITNACRYGMLDRQPNQIMVITIRDDNFDGEAKN